MAIYILIILILLLLYRSELTKDTKIAFTLILLIFISGFRDGVGTDYNMYKDIFYNIHHIENIYAGGVEIGFELINKIAYGIYENHVLLFLITSIIIIGLTIKNICDYSKFYSYSVILFIMMGYYHSSFNGVRQHLAMAIGMFALRYILKKDFIKYLICIIIAMMFHKTALILLPIYFIINIKLSKKHYYISLGLAIIVGLSSDIIIYQILPIISPYYFNKYVDTIYLSNGIGGITNVIHITMFIIIAGLTIKNLEKMTKIDKTVNVFLNFSIIGIVLVMLGTQSLLLFRLSLYFTEYFIFLIPVLLKYLKEEKLASSTEDNKWIRYTYIIIILWICFMYINTLVGRDGAIPYMNVLF